MVIKGYSCSIKGTYAGDIQESEIVECFPYMGFPKGIQDDFPDGSKFAFGNMPVGFFGIRSVTLMKWIFPADNRTLLPIQERNYWLRFLMIGSDRDCRKAKSKLEKTFDIKLEEEEYDF